MPVQVYKKTILLLEFRKFAMWDLLLLLSISGTSKIDAAFVDTVRHLLSGDNALRNAAETRYADARTNAKYM